MPALARARTKKAASIVLSKANLGDFLASPPPLPPLAHTLASEQPPCLALYSEGRLLALLV